MENGVRNYSRHIIKTTRDFRFDIVVVCPPCKTRNELIRFAFYNEIRLTTSERCSISNLLENRASLLYNPIMFNIDFNNIKVGDRIELGTYPQGIVNDPDIEHPLKDICGAPRISEDSPWRDYDNQDGKGMYADIEYAGKRYRLMYKEKYRGSKLLSKYCDYRNKRIHVFLYEPIVWRVLKITDNVAMLSAERALDAQEFCVKKNGLCKRKDGYKNNYEHSYIRQWLNCAFFETAFDDAEKALISTSVICNGPQTIKSSKDTVTCNDTEDKVFLLSFEEAKTLFANNKDRWKKATEYTKARDGFAYKTHDAKYNNVSWWLRSPCLECSVRCVGDGGGIAAGGGSSAREAACALEAVVPAVYIKL